MSRVHKYRWPLAGIMALVVLSGIYLLLSEYKPKILLAQWTLPGSGAPSQINELAAFPTIHIAANDSSGSFWKNNVSPQLSANRVGVSAASIAAKSQITAPAGKTPLVLMIDARELTENALRALIDGYGEWKQGLSENHEIHLLLSQTHSPGLSLAAGLNLGIALTAKQLTSTANIAAAINQFGKVSFIYLENLIIPVQALIHLQKWAHEQCVALLVNSPQRALPPYNLNATDEMIPINPLPTADPKNMEWLISDGDPRIITMPQMMSDQFLVNGVPSETRISIVGTSEKKTETAGEIRQRRKVSQRGLYATSIMAGNKTWMLRTVTQMKKLNLDTLVINVKDIEGIVGMRFGDPLSKEIGGERGYIPDFKRLVDELHAQDLRVCARVTAFRDHQLAQHKPQWALHGPGGSFTGWLDPAQPEAGDYLIRLAEYAAKAGADAIQFDYIRYPERGTVAWEQEPSAAQKANHIENFLRRAYQRLAPYDVSLEADVFGIMLWQTEADLSVTGQHLRRMARYLDAISPMIYPSHFSSGFHGISTPANEPYRMVSDSAQLMFNEMGDLNICFVPWLQGFSYRVSSYGPWYLQAQIKALRAHNISHFLIWNARNVYDTSYESLKELNRVTSTDP